MTKKVPPKNPATHTTMPHNTLDVIEPDSVGTLAALFRERVNRSADSVAYRSYDNKNKHWKDISWQESARQVARLQAALKKEPINPGDRVAIMLRNCPEWVQFEQAAMGLGLVVVPLYPNDRADNVSYVLQDAGVKILLLEDHEQVKTLESISSQIDGLIRVLSVKPCKHYNMFSRLLTLDEWTQGIDNITADSLETYATDPEALATIVYTSGTTGRPKGVMLSHKNILYNAYIGGGKTIPIRTNDLFLSFLPLSHMLERSIGYYIPMMCGCTVAFARSVQDLAEDLLAIKPTVLISVPRIYERVHNKIQTQLEHKSPIARGLFLKAVETGWQRFKTGKSPLIWPILKHLVAGKVMAKLGGRLRIAICGGAPLSPTVAKTFIGLGLNLLQGYGLTETSPVIAVNHLDDNDPASVGLAFEGVETKIGENDELLARGHCVMLGYWNNEKATQDMIDKDGWLHTGDKAKIVNNHIYITGRIKDIIVLSNGEKVPPNDMEMAISMDSIFEQVLVIGEGKPYLSALVVINTEDWSLLSEQLGIDVKCPADLNAPDVRNLLKIRIAKQLRTFPGYAQVKRITVCDDLFSVENGLMTPTLKLKRNLILEKYADEVEAMYKGH